MSWQAAARNAADDYDQAEQERDEQDAERTVEHLLALADVLGVSDAQTAEQVDVVGDLVTVHLPATPGEPDVQLRAHVAIGKPEVTAWVRLPRTDEWYPRGPVSTLVDLGRALDPAYVAELDAPELEPTVPELLHTVLTALVRDVVADELDGRLGDGPA